MIRWRFPLVGVCTACAAVVLDQVSKAAVRAHLPLYASVPVVGPVVKLTHTRNPGVAFGISLGALNGWFLTVLTACGVALIGIYLFRQGTGGCARAVMIGLVLGGAIGNFLDRVRWGEVVDFLDIGIGSYRWPVFNVADLVVVLGAALLFLSEHRDDHGPGKPPRP